MQINSDHITLLLPTDAGRMFITERMHLNRYSVQCIEPFYHGAMAQHQTRKQAACTSKCNPFLDVLFRYWPMANMAQL